MMPHAFRFYSSLWSVMHDLCVTCAKKCAVAMDANVLKTAIRFVPNIAYL